MSLFSRRSSVGVSSYSSLLKLFLTLLLVAALPVFIWAVATQRIELRKRAATGENVVCWNRVIAGNGGLMWPNGCKGNPNPGMCTQATVPLSATEIYGYNAWVGEGRPTIPGCGANRITPTPTGTASQRIQWIHPSVYARATNMAINVDNKVFRYFPDPKSAQSKGQTGGADTIGFHQSWIENGTEVAVWFTFKEITTNLTYPPNGKEWQLISVSVNYHISPGIQKEIRFDRDVLTKKITGKYGFGWGTNQLYLASDPGSPYSAVIEFNNLELGAFINMSGPTRTPTPSPTPVTQCDTTNEGMACSRCKPCLPGVPCPIACIREYGTCKNSQCNVTTTPTPTPGVIPNTDIKIITPSNNQAVMVGNDIDITWTAPASISTIWITYVIGPGGGIYEPIGNGIPNTGKYTWKVQALADYGNTIRYGVYEMRLEGYINGQTRAISGVNFNIVQPGLTPPPPTGCYYKQVQCVKAPCNPILVCPTSTPTPPSVCTGPNGSPCVTTICPVCIPGRPCPAVACQRVAGSCQNGLCMGGVTPTPTCSPRPACMDPLPGQPQCMIKMVEGAWFCPKTPTPTPSCTPRPACMDPLPGQPQCMIKMVEGAWFCPKTPTPTTLCKAGVNSFAVTQPCSGAPNMFTLATYACYDGFTGTVGNGAKCFSSLDLSNMAQQACIGRTSCTPRVETIADLNGDGKVNIFDYNTFLKLFSIAGKPEALKADFNKDGILNIFDYNILLKAFK